MKIVDLAILGGGCAGLSLARDLARAEAGGADVPTTLVIEPRKTYSNDRTWCFWDRHGTESDLVTERWSQWRFSSGQRSLVHSSEEWEYCCIPADRFYRDAVNAIATSGRIDLRLGLSANTVEPGPEDLLIETPEGLVRARQIVDTRPPSREQLSRSRLFQQFAGAEIECDLPAAHAESVGLMDRMMVDDLGLRFDYVLPLSPTRLLVEATRFSAACVPDAQLHTDLEISLARCAPIGGYRILRTEKGLIPMGLPPQAAPRDPRWIVAGTGGGAVRAASGYAFQRIQKWSAACAESVLRGRRPITQLAERPLQRKMDHLLLDLLRDDPDLGPTVFMMLAQNVAADTLVRFLSDQADHGDLLAIIRALPPLPFLRQLANSAFQLPRREPADCRAA